MVDPERLADWMGAAWLEPRTGGRIELMTDGPHPMVGTIRIWDVPCVLEFTWSNTHSRDSVVRYELEPAPAGTRLVFTHIGVPFANSALTLPGWHDYLTRLEGVVTAQPPPPEPGRWRRLQALYIVHHRLEHVVLDP